MQGGKVIDEIYIVKNKACPTWLQQWDNFTATKLNTIIT